jgi:hypothetical protein
MRLSTYMIDLYDLELTESSDRTNPPSNFVKHNVRKTNIQSRLLRSSRVLLTTGLTANGASSRARSRTHKELAGLAFAEEGFDQANRVEAINRDYRNVGEHERRFMRKGQGNIRARWPKPMKCIEMQTDVSTSACIYIQRYPHSKGRPDVNTICALPNVPMP